MIDERRRRDEQRLRHAQEIAAALRDRRAELLEELRGTARRAQHEPVDLAAYRRRAPAWALPDDVC